MAPHLSDEMRACIRVCFDCYASCAEICRRCAASCRAMAGKAA